MNKKITSLLSAAIMFIAFMPAATTSAAGTEVLTENKVGTQDGYDYELWKDRGTTSMTLNDGGTFDCSWSNINNALFRKGKKFDCTKTYKELGNISIDFGCDYKPSGNSYLCVYGWTKSPLVEYYIVDSWGSWRPPGAQSKGTTMVDGELYDIYETDRINQPSIEGNTTFKQFWSVRRTKRTSGTISVTKHFEAWDKLGMKLGKLFETALNIEGYQSSGTAKVYKNNLTIGTNTDQPGTDKPNPDKPVPDKPVPTGKLKLDYNINNWGSGYQVSFKVTNNSSSDVDGWTLKIKKSNLNINSSWNINIKEDGDYYLITPVSWNSKIAKGNSIDFGVQGSGSIGQTIDYTLS